MIVCVFDAAAGFLPVDRETARLLERSGKPVVWVVNKVDGPKRENLLHDFWSAGVGGLLPTSAAHGLGIGELREAIAAALPPPAGDTTTAAEGIRLSLLGRPNVGKSSLLNRLLGQERTIVTPTAGTTRDAIDTAVTVDGEPWVLIDTAGIRRRMRVEDPLERHGAVRALSALERTDVALVVLDATEGMTDQDARIVARAWDAGRGVVLLANKWDLLPPGGRDASAFRKALAVHRPAFADLPLLCVSARTGDGLAGLFPLVRRVAAAHQRTIPTAALNRALAEAVEANPPPNPKGRPVRLYYATQTGTRPPELTIFTNSTAPPPAAYARFVTNRLLAAFELIGVPLRIRYRARPRAGVSGAPGPDSARRTRRTKPPGRAPKRSRRR